MKNPRYMEFFTIEHKVLFVLYICSYLMAMFIQIKDPNTKVDFSDWFLALFTSAIGAVITYYIAMSWANIGFRMGATILASLVSYRTFKFIVSEEAQEQFAKGFFSGIMNVLSNLFNAKK